MENIDLSSSEKRLKEEYELLTKEYAFHYSEHQNMINNVGPTLSAQYLQAVGYQQYEIVRLQFEIKLLSMREKLLRQYVNKDETPDIDAVNKETEKIRHQFNERLQGESQKLHDAEEYLKSPVLSLEESKELKQLYQSIVKATHPDVNPKATEEMIEIFRRATTMYKGVDLDGLRSLYDFVISAGMAGGLNHISSWDYEVSQLKYKIDKLMEKIDKLWQTFPFTYAKELSDPEWIKQRQSELNETIKQLTERRDYLQQVVTLLEEYESQGY